MRKPEAAGLVSADIEVSADGKAMKFYEVTPFAVLADTGNDRVRRTHAHRRLRPSGVTSRERVITRPT